LSNALDDNAWYGFLSPKFKEKTKLTSDDDASGTFQRTVMR
jgi:hypothetical protein